MASLKQVIAPTLLIAGAVFTAFTVPLAIMGDRQVTIRMDRDVVYDGIVRDVSLPYIAFSMIVSLGAGLTTMTITGWSTSTKRNIALENEREALRAEIHEKSIHIDELKLSSANLAASGLNAFLDTTEAMPQATDTIAELLDDEPALTTPVASAKPPSAPLRSQQPPLTIPVEPRRQPEPLAPAAISGEVLHVYGALQDRFDHLATPKPQSSDRTVATSRAYTPSATPPVVTPPISEPAVVTQVTETVAPVLVPTLNEALMTTYALLHQRLHAVESDLSQPASRTIATSRAYTPASAVTAAVPPRVTTQSIQPVRAESASISEAIPPHAAPQPQATPTVAKASIKPVPVVPVLDATEPNQEIASSLVVEPAVVKTQPDDLDSTAPTPWDSWLPNDDDEPSVEAAPLLPAALASLDSWLVYDEEPEIASDPAIAAWDQWLQDQQRSPDQPPSHSTFDAWLASTVAVDEPDEAYEFELPLAAPMTRSPVKVVRFQRNHPRRDS